ncbi:MAG: FMN-binding negative transcriptional regulator [Bacteroidota bacterium]
MFIPEIYNQKDPDAIAAFIAANPFGILCVNGNFGPEAVHIPFLQSPEDPGLLISHFAFDNPIAQTLADNPDVLLIFQGGSAYISPTWYNHVNVPTYNYRAVHVRGQVKLIHNNARLLEILDAQIKQFENENSGYSLAGLPADMIEDHLPGIIGIELTVKSIEAAWKLSQNRDAESYGNIVNELGKCPHSRSVADAMKEQRPAEFRPGENQGG